MPLRVQAEGSRPGIAVPEVHQPDMIVGRSGGELRRGGGGSGGGGGLKEAIGSLSRIVSLDEFERRRR